jgi:hypothetical protein
MNALVVAAWVDPAVRDGVADLVANRFLDGMEAYQKRAGVIGPMAHLALATPGMYPKVSELARETLQRVAALEE